MKIKLDENIPVQCVPLLEQLGHNIDTVPDEGLAGATDDAVWAAAQQAGRVFITQDLDFSDVRRFRPGTHAGIILFRLREPGRHAVSTRLRSIFESESVERWGGAFVVITDHKIRVRAPSP